MRSLDKCLVAFGLWIVSLYLLGLLFSYMWSLQEGLTTQILIVSILVLILYLSRQAIGTKFNWRVLFILCFALLMVLPLALKSGHILGVDSHREYWFFVQSDRANDIYQYGHMREGGCLSVTLLPLYFQDITGANPERLFNILYPILFCVYPLIIYCISRKFVKERYALFAGLIVCLQPLFIWTVSNARMSVGVTFLTLCVLVLFSEFKFKWLVLSLLVLGTIFSYYGAAYMLAGVLVPALLLKSNWKDLVFPVITLFVGTYLWLEHTGLENMLERYF